MSGREAAVAAAYEQAGRRWQAVRSRLLGQALIDYAHLLRLRGHEDIQVPLLVPGQAGEPPRSLLPFKQHRRQHRHEDTPDTAATVGTRGWQVRLGPGAGRRRR